MKFWVLMFLVPLSCRPTPSAKQSESKDISISHDGTEYVLYRIGVEEFFLGTVCLQQDCTNEFYRYVSKKFLWDIRKIFKNQNDFNSFSSKLRNKNSFSGSEFPEEVLNFMIDTIKSKGKKFTNYRTELDEEVLSIVGRAVNIELTGCELEGRRLVLSVKSEDSIEKIGGNDFQLCKSFETVTYLFDSAATCLENKARIQAKAESRNISVNPRNNGKKIGCWQDNGTLKAAYLEQEGNCNSKNYLISDLHARTTSLDACVFAMKQNYGDEADYVGANGSGSFQPAVFYAKKGQIDTVVDNAESCIQISGSTDCQSYPSLDSCRSILPDWHWACVDTVNKIVIYRP